MFSKILVALDNSPLRGVVFNQALQLAQKTGASLSLLHVLSAYEEGSPVVPIHSYQAYYPILDDAIWKDYQERWGKFETDRLARLQAEADQALAAGICTEFSQVVGDPAPTICATAQSSQADLIVVGSHGRRGLEAIMLGSVSNYVMHRAPCSVLVVRGGLTPAGLTTAAMAQPQPAPASMG
ncbi:MAG: universal stress protein [Cyanobacteria bacterium REEB459]|nr:universal stress protein [Cyanobacteria bacterium REEB459]